MNLREKSRQEYIARINRVTDYIDKNLHESLDLATVAEAAVFSPFHFHRIFTFMIGETPVDYIQRLRLEKSASLLRNKEKTISDIACECGFGSISLFSRTFKKYFGITPTLFRKTEKPVFSKDGSYYDKNGQPLRKNLKTFQKLPDDLCNVQSNQLVFMETKIEVKKMPDMNVIYCRHTGPFNQIGKAYEKVARWAIPRDLYQPGKTKTMTVTHDDPSVTKIDKVRQSACIVIDKDVKTEGEIGRMTVPGGKYAVGRFELGFTDFERAWNTMCLWFTESGYSQGDGCTYELYHNDYTQHPEQKHIVDICIPVKPL